jgi:hypothetical protein
MNQNDEMTSSEGRTLSVFRQKGAGIMSAFRNLYLRTKNFFVQNPALVSGYIIYSYLFISIIRLFLKVKQSGATLSDAYDIFSALPFMWLLAVSLVKVIEFRSLVHIKDEVLQIQNTQIRTMHEVVKGLQHQVNNPLAIISLSIGRIKKIVGSNPIAKTKVENIEIATQQIIAALQKFSEAEQYESQHIDKVVGTIASLPKKH